MRHLYCLLFLMTHSLFAQHNFDQTPLKDLSAGTRIDILENIDTKKSCPTGTQQAPLYLYFTDGEMTCSTPGLMNMTSQMTCRIPVAGLAGGMLKKSTCTVDKITDYNDVNRFHFTKSCSFTIDCQASTPCLWMKKLGMECDGSVFRVKNLKNQFQSYASISPASSATKVPSQVHDETRTPGKPVIVPSSHLKIIQSQGSEE